ncbi:hypothetical protein RRG08_025147 [Elysia crispata]|uniref:Uncharacterized protein n=1 Tax=Elysia crispata TaxID=231223 RepID=A0AAE0YAQ5_9GAST|nr:hypothetical protein RRG08_025147 [Elysia crispata]
MLEFSVYIGLQCSVHCSSHDGTFSWTAKQGSDTRHTSERAMYGGVMTSGVGDVGRKALLPRPLVSSTGTAALDMIVLTRCANRYGHGSVCSWGRWPGVSG